MAKHVIFLVVVVFCSTTLFTQVQHDVASASGQKDGLAGNVDVSSVVKIFVATGTPGYIIAYNYDFPRRSSVYIKGLGTAAAKGSFSYVTTDRNLEFRDSPNGKILSSQTLQETVVVAARPPLLPTPSADDFPKEYQSFTWDSQKTLQERAQTVANKYFHLAADGDCDKGESHLRTTYTPLEMKNASSGVTAQVAVLISYPCDPKVGSYPFKVQSLVMEGRTHSDTFKHTDDPDVVHAGDVFVQNLIVEMKTGESSKP